MDLDEIQLPTDFSSVTDAQLDELEQVARAAAVPLAEASRNVDTFSDDDLSTLERLATVVQGVAAERKARVSAAVTNGQKSDRAKTAGEVFSTTDKPGTEPDDEGDGDGEAEDPKPEAAKGKKTGVAAIAAAGTKVDAPEVDTAERSHFSTLTAATGAIGVRAGDKFPDWKAVGQALEESMATYSSLGEGQFQKNPVLQIKRNYPEDQRLTTRDTWESATEKMDNLVKESRLPGGSLVAAAGWCAPSQILYDLYEIENGTDGLVDLPEMQISRGGIQFTPGPDFSAIWGGSSTTPVWPQGFWHQTETQVQAARVKPTMVVPCPSFTNVRLEVDGIQITGAFLQDRGYPELVARFSRGAMVVHNRRLNAFALNVMTDGSTLIDMTGANWPAATVESKDLTTLSRLLAAFGNQAMDYRYRYRMGLTDTLEAKLPYWVLESVRADVQRRTALDPDSAFSLAMSQVVNWFAVRNIRVQFVYDWQDSFNTPTTVLQWSNATDGTARFTVATNTNVGNPASQIYVMPSTVFGLLYAPGTWVRGVSDVIRLDTVYDSTNLALNQYVQLFTEEGVLVAKRGYESRLLKLTIEPSGTTSATTAMTF